MSSGPIAPTLLAQLESMAAATRHRKPHLVIAAERRSHLQIVPPVKPPRSAPGDRN